MDKFDEVEDDCRVRDFIEISPNDIAPVFVVRNDKVNTAVMKWGFAVSGSRTLVINARSEDAHDRSMFRRLLENNRCAVPVSGYYEWRDSDHQKFLVSPKKAEGFYLVGLYRYDESGEYRFVVFTREAYGAHSKIHHRMPVVLPTSADVVDWLSGRQSLESVAGKLNADLGIDAKGPEQICMDWSEV